MKPDTTITVVLVDDHAVVREGYRRLLERAGDVHVVGEAASAAEACKVAAQCRPDVVVMDISLPDISGIEGMRRLLARDAGIRVLMFSIHDEPIFPRRAFAAGAARLRHQGERAGRAGRRRAYGRRRRTFPQSRTSHNHWRCRACPETGATLASLSPREFEIARIAGARAHLVRDCREALAQRQDGRQSPIAHPTEARCANRDAVHPDRDAERIAQRCPLRAMGGAVSITG